jgi:hypothetical protein
MPVVINQMQAQVSEPPSERSAPASSIAPKPLERDAVLRLLRLSAERHARLAAD